MNIFQDVLLKRYDQHDTEVYFQASILGVIHISIILLFTLLLNMTFTSRMMDIIFYGVIGLGLVSLVFLYNGFHRVVTSISVTGMGLLASLTAFAVPDFQHYEAYLLASSHMLIILVSSLITHQKRYTLLTAVLGVVYLLVHLIVRVIPALGENLFQGVDDTFIAIFMVTLTGFIVIRSLQRRQRLLAIAQEESDLKDLRATALEKSLKEREVLINEVHHRVKNNLNVAISLIRMQMEKVELEDKSRNILDDSIGRLHSMALVHERLYAGGNISAVEFNPYIASIFQTVLLSYKSPNLEFEVDVDSDLQIGVDRAVPVGLILNELITNVYKHAFHEGQNGRAVVSFHSADNQYTLTVKDSGVGIPITDWSEATSLGLRVVYLLVEQLVGTLHVDNTQGTRVEITFPMATG